MPGLFALGDKVIANPTMSYFLAFGSFAMVLLVDFRGPLTDRVRSQACLAVAGAALICLGTLAGQLTPVAVILTGVVGCGIIFAGVVSSVLASASTSLLLAFILGVSLPGPVTQIPDRLAGWGLAGAVSVLAITLLWPAPVSNPIRLRVIEACHALAERLRAQVEVMEVRSGPDGAARRDAAIRRTEAASQSLAQTFFATPVRPTGLSSDARAVVRLVDELRWLNAIVALAAPPGPEARPHPEVSAVKSAAADVLDLAGETLLRPRESIQALRQAHARLFAQLHDLETLTTAHLTLPNAIGAHRPGAGAVGDPAMARAAISALDPGFRAQELSYVVGQIARNVEYAAAAQQRSWPARILGRQPAGFDGALSSARERARAHARRDSAWLHNSLRGGAALAASVLVADLLSVQHGFWVVFGTLAVLRTNALSTGQSMVRAVLGTSAGFAVGGVIVAAVGAHPTALWILLPVSVLAAGIAPSVISFAAGQAAFTMTLLLLFNLLAPVGWRIGIIRVEDVLIGGVVSLGVGLVFWPRGAAQDLVGALAAAYAASIEYLSGAIDVGLSACGAPRSGAVPSARDRSQVAAAAARRLDDTFRGYLADRGTKQVPLAEVVSLVSGVAGVRLAADAVVDLWRDPAPDREDHGEARHELERSEAQISAWFAQFADGLAGATTLPDALEYDVEVESRLIAAVARDFGDGTGHTSPTGVRVLWTGDHLDAVRRLQASLLAPARTAVAAHAFDA